MDRGLVLMSLSSLQELLRLPPGRIHEIGIKLHDITEATAVAAALEVQLGKTLPVRVRAWPELAPELADLRAVQSPHHFYSLFHLFPVGGHWHHEHHAHGGDRAHA